MITRVEIRNFKSIRELDFSLKRVNVIIGEPNTGKSNVLEALAVFSEGIYEGDGKIIQEILRYKTVSELFYDRELSEVVRIATNEGLVWTLRYDSSQFKGQLGIPDQHVVNFTISSPSNLHVTQFVKTGVRYYRFNPLSGIQQMQYGILHAPYGDNLAALISTNKRLRALVNDLFLQRGFRSVIDTDKNDFGMVKVVNDQLYTFSFPTISETFRRIIFFMAMLETNENATLLLDEPEANTFPFYTKYLAERIALNGSNQFIITTHNPYLLSSIVEKTPTSDLAVFVSKMDMFATKLTPLPENKLPELLELDADAFFNLDRLASA